MELVFVAIVIAYRIIDIFIWAVLISVVISWLFAFNVLDYSKPLVRKTTVILYRFTEPVMEPVRNAMPSLGGIDISPIVVLLGAQGLQIGLIQLQQYLSVM